MTTHPSWLDLKLGFRLLVRYPGLTLVGGISIAFAVAIGAGAFEFVHQLVSPTLPLPGGERIVGLRVWDAAANREEDRAAYDLAAWRSAITSIEDLGAFRLMEHNLIVDEGRAEPIEVAAISASAFRAARVPALLGRTLNDADEQPGASPVIVIGHDVWRRDLAADPAVVGRTIRLGNVPTTIVGVMPPAFAFPISQSAWVPLEAEAMRAQPRQGHALRLFGRLAPGATLAQAQAELTRVGMRSSAALPETHKNLRPQVMPFARLFLDLPPAVLYSINLFFVMLLALVCANVALLMFARAATRETDIIVRVALGASRARIIAQLFAEALVLMSVAVVIGLFATQYLLRWWLAVSTIEAGGRLAFWFDDRLAPATYLYAALLTLVGAAIAGITPALKATRRVEPQLRQVSAGGGGLQFGGIWTAVIVAQVAITVLFPAATFFVRRNVIDLQSLDVGFRSREYLSARLEMDHETPRATYEELERRLAAESGVAGVTFTDRLPKTVHSQRWIEVDVAGSTPQAAPGAPSQVTVASVAVNYFDVLGARSIAGRGFHSGDLLPAPATRNVVVNQSFVRTVLQGSNAIGRRVRYLTIDADDIRSASPQRGPWLEIVGVVPDLGTLHDDPADLSALYRPFSPGEVTPTFLAVHLMTPPDAFASRLRAAAAAVDPSLQLHEVMPLDAVGATMWTEFDFLSRLLSVVSAMAMLLSLAGIYAALSFTVSRRTREIGIRVALGASRQRVLLSIFRRPLAQVGAGIVCGGALVLVITDSVMPGGLSLATASAVVSYAAFMMGSCLIACIVPTRRALRIEPTTALRADG